MLSRTLRVAAALALVAVPSASFAQSTQSSTIAEALFREAQTLLEAGNVHAACEKFAASQKVEPTIGTLLNLAACHEKEGLTATAWTEYAEVASLAQRAGDKDREKYARARNASLEKNLGRVSIEVARPVADQEVLLDGQKLAREVWGSGIPLDPGEHTVEARAPKKTSWMKKITLAAGAGVERIEVPALEDAEKAAAAPPVAAKPPAPEERAEEKPPASSGSSPLLGYSLVGVGVIGLGLATYFGLSARGHADERDKICPPGTPCDRQSAFDEHDDAKSAQTMMFVSGGVGVVAAGVGAYFLLTAPSASSAPKKSGGLRVQPSFRPGAYDVRLEGSF